MNNFIIDTFDASLSVEYGNGGLVKVSIADRPSHYATREKDLTALLNEGQVRDLIDALKAAVGDDE